MLLNWVPSPLRRGGYVFTADVPDLGVVTVRPARKPLHYFDGWLGEDKLGTWENVEQAQSEMETLVEGLMA